MTLFKITHPIHSVMPPPLKEIGNRGDSAGLGFDLGCINSVDAVLTRSTQSKPKEEYKIYPHNPPHLFKSNAKYFITTSTYKSTPYFKSPKAKARMIWSLEKGFSENDWEIEDWVILDNHYHLMVNAQ